MHPLDILVREHALVMLGLDLLDRAALAGERVRGAELTRLLDFFGSFLDEHHHVKEELELFPAMIDAGFPAHGGPLATMLAEHDRGRSLAGSMRRAIHGDRERFAASAGTYSSLMRAHVEKENGVLFPMAERFVQSATLAHLGERWRSEGGVESRWRDELASIDRALRAS